MTILLDVDGVLIRDTILLNHVKHNAVRYVAKKLPNVKRPSYVNSVLYNNYGHTALGLFIEFGVDTKDFDKFVYDRFLLDHLEDHVRTDENFKRDARVIKKLCDEENVALFSNAPLVWTEPIREAIDLRIGNGEYRKPNLESYLRFGNEDHFTFVDDKMDNLRPTLMFKNWTPIHYSTTQESQMVKNIYDLKDLDKSNNK